MHLLIKEKQNTCQRDLLLIKPVGKPVLGSEQVTAGQILNVRGALKVLHSALNISLAPRVSHKFIFYLVLRSHCDFKPTPHQRRFRLRWLRKESFSARTPRMRRCWHG